MLACPGLRSCEHAAMSNRDAHILGNYGRFPQRFVKGEGTWLIDEQGRRFIDCLAGIAVNVIGHGHPHLVQAIQDQAATLLHTSNLFNIPQQERLADRLCALGAGDRVFFCNSGGEANETAFKAVRLWGNVKHGGRKTKVIAAESGFHGRSLGALSLTGRPEYHKGFEPLFEVTFVPYGDIDAMVRAMGPDVAGVFLEPIQGEGGVHVPPRGYLQAVRSLCDEHQALLCLDEVQTGIGRSGKFFCFEHSEVKPDVVQMAKGLGGGVPIGAVGFREDVAELLKPGTHGSTFGGNYLACAAGNAVLDIVCADGFLDRVQVAAERLRSALPEIFGDCIEEVRGRGLLIGVQLKDMPKTILKHGLDAGIICGTAGGGVLRLAPPLTISDSEIDEAMARLKSAWQAASA